MKVLILGRTNVGKSSLFNRLIKKKKSLVINESKITRDLLKAKVEWWGEEFEVTDSGGLPQSKEKDSLSVEILKKIKQAIFKNDVFVVVVDGKAGLHFEDEIAVKMARHTGKPFFLFVNKVDDPKQTHFLTAPFFKLNPELCSGSFEQNYGVDQIIEWIIAQKKKNVSPSPTSSSSQASSVNLVSAGSPASSGSLASSGSPASSVIPKSSVNPAKAGLSKKPTVKNRPTQLFVIGRANSGKSLLCNQILQQDRMIVLSQSGTTLDTVTEAFSYNKKDYLISDNPGARRGSREEREKISFAKSRSELNTADIALLVVDGTLGPGRQEAGLVKLCLDKHKAVLLVINKMDLLKKLSTEERKQQKEKIKKVFHFYSDLPTVFLSAKTGYHKDQLFKNIEQLKQKIYFRASTSELNNFFTKVIRKAPAPVYGTSDVKFYYIVQTHKKPPEFIAFANYPKGVTPAYSRFVVNQIKKKWGLKGIPINFHVLPKR